MENPEVRIVELSPLRVARVHAFGESPELKAWDKLIAWAEPRGLLPHKERRVFGFNNPSPSPGSPNYGYEFWLELKPGEAVTGDAEERAFDGGLYAVAPVSGVDKIGQAWKSLVTWLEASPYDHGRHQWLEEHLTRADVPPEELALLLYLPVKA